MYRKITKNGINKKLRRTFKEVIFIGKLKRKETTPVFILGSGRSGTTLLLDIFHYDLRVQSLGENNLKIAQNFLLNYDKLNSTLSKGKTELLVCKPILNSFEAKYLLKNYPACKILWMIRDYKDVIASSEKKFGSNTVELFMEALNSQVKNNWISKGIHRESLDRINRIKIKDFNFYDYLGLIWWSVNNTVRIDNLSENKRFKIIQYEQFVNHNEIVLNEIYRFIGLPYKSTSIQIYKKSVNKGNKIVLSEEIDKLCNSLKKYIYHRS